MKKPISFFADCKAYLLFFAFSVLASKGISQTDTLHLIYHHTQNKAHDTTLARIDRWIKSLNGRHVDITVVGYYHQANFKPFAQDRIDEMFLILNRKARAQLTFGEFVTKKGKDYQRTMVDIIYKTTVTPEQAAAAKAKAKTDAEAAKADEKKKKEDEKAAKESEKPAKDSGKAAKESDKKTKSEAASAEKGAKGKDKKTEKVPANPGLEANGYPGKKPAGSKGAFVTQSDIERLKSAKLIVPRTSRPAIDSMLTEAVKKFWKFTSNVEYGTMTYNEAKKVAKEDKNVFIFIVTTAVSKSLTHKGAQIGSWVETYREVSKGSVTMLEDGKGNNPPVSCYFPTFGEDYEVTQEGLAFAVSEMSSIASNLEKYNIKNNMTYNKPFKQNAPMLKDRTLLIPDFWLSEKIELDELTSLYEGKCQLVTYNEWSDAILSKRKYAYVMIAPTPIGGDYIYLHYLMDASTGDVLYISKPKMAAKVQGFNVSAANTGYINKRCLKLYNEAFDMNAKEEEPAAEEAKAEDGKAKEGSEEKGSKEKADEGKKEKAKKEKEEKPKEKEKKKEK